MITLQQTDAGILLVVKAIPGASRDEIRGAYQGMLKVAVTAAAKKGKANKAVVRLLANQLNLRQSQLQLVAGQLQSEKRLLISEISISDVADKISQFCSADQ